MKPTLGLNCVEASISPCGQSDIQPTRVKFCFMEAEDFRDNFFNDILRLPGLKYVNCISLIRSHFLVESVLIPIFSSTSIRSVNELTIPFTEVDIYAFIYLLNQLGIC